MSEERNKIILYLDKLKKIFIVYDKPADKKKEVLMQNVDVVYNGVNKYVDTFKEKWELNEIEETESTLNELTVTLKFKLKFRKTK